MKRITFIWSAISIFPLNIFAKKLQKNFQNIGKGFKVKSGEGRIHGHMKLAGVNSNVLDLKISGKDTNNGMAIFEQTSLSQGKGTPLHIHPLQDEVFYVLEGKYYFQVGNEKFTLEKGETAFLPKNVPHAWSQASETGKMIVTFQPAGKMENFFAKVASLNHSPSQAEMAEIFLENEMKIVGQPLEIGK